jgi:transcriptional regulator with XRE-family HTH domain
MLKNLRLAAGLSRLELGILAAVSDVTIFRIEAGVRRTRVSTLERIAYGLCHAAPTLGDPAGVLADLCTVAHLGLAPESEFADRVQRRRQRRERRFGSVFGQCGEDPNAKPNFVAVGCDVLSGTGHIANASSLSASLNREVSR